MKASTLFVICIALFIGLAAMAGAKYAGLFDAKKVVETNKEEPMLVLVATNDMYPGLLISSANVRVRELTPEERVGGYYEKNKGKLLPANILAADLRVPNKKIEADTILRRDMFEDDLVKALTPRLAEGMAAVNVSVPKERSAGGVIQLGEYVNVYLTSRIKEGDKESIRTAQIARDCRVIMKRNILYQKLAMDADGPIPFTLEANPYRAALIDFAQHKGELSLQPIYNSKARVRDENPLQDGKKDGMVKYSDMNSDEYIGEDSRVTKLLRGDLRIGDADMARVFGIQPRHREIWFLIQGVSGVDRKGTQTFDLDNQRDVTPSRKTPSSTTPASGPSISSPKDDKECKNCDKKKDKGINDPPPFEKK